MFDDCIAQPYDETQAGDASLVIWPAPIEPPAPVVDPLFAPYFNEHNQLVIYPQLLSTAPGPMQPPMPEALNDAHQQLLNTQRNWTPPFPGYTSVYDPSTNSVDWYENGQNTPTVPHS